MRQVTEKSNCSHKGLSKRVWGEILLNFSFSKVPRAEPRDIKTLPGTPSKEKMMSNQLGKIRLTAPLLIALALMIWGLISAVIQKADERERKCPTNIVHECQYGPEESRAAHADLCAEYKARVCWGVYKHQSQV